LLSELEDSDLELEEVEVLENDVVPSFDDFPVGMSAEFPSVLEAPFVETGENGGLRDAGANSGSLDIEPDENTEEELDSDLLDELFDELDLTCVNFAAEFPRDLNFTDAASASSFEVITDSIPPSSSFRKRLLLFTAPFPFTGFAALFGGTQTISSSSRSRELLTIVFAVVVVVEVGLGSVLPTGGGFVVGALGTVLGVTAESEFPCKLLEALLDSEFPAAFVFLSVSTPPAVSDSDAVLSPTFLLLLLEFSKMLASVESSFSSSDSDGVGRVAASVFVFDLSPTFEVVEVPPAVFDCEILDSAADAGVSVFVLDLPSTLGIVELASVVLICEMLDSVADAVPEPVFVSELSPTPTIGAAEVDSVVLNCAILDSVFDAAVSVFVLDLCSGIGTAASVFLSCERLDSLAIVVVEDSSSPSEDSGVVSALDFSSTVGTGEVASVVLGSETLDSDAAVVVVSSSSPFGDSDSSSSSLPGSTFKRFSEFTSKSEGLEVVVVVVVVVVGFSVALEIEPDESPAFDFEIAGEVSALGFLAYVLEKETIASVSV
jgi:hypothetical protein